LCRIWPKENTVKEGKEFEKLLTRKRKEKQGRSKKKKKGKGGRSKIALEGGAKRDR
jgi:hypothetical protein